MERARQLGLAVDGALRDLFENEGAVRVPNEVRVGGGSYPVPRGMRAEAGAIAERFLGFLLRIHLMLFEVDRWGVGKRRTVLSVTGAGSFDVLCRVWAGAGCIATRYVPFHGAKVAVQFKLRRAAMKGSKRRLQWHYWFADAKKTLEQAPAEHLLHNVKIVVFVIESSKDRALTEVAVTTVALLAWDGAKTGRWRPELHYAAGPLVPANGCEAEVCLDPRWQELEKKAFNAPGVQGKLVKVHDTARTFFSSSSAASSLKRKFTDAKLNTWDCEESGKHGKTSSCCLRLDDVKAALPQFPSEFAA